MSVKFNFSGKVALVTGSSSGIGAGIALLYAKSGANVVVTGRNVEKISKISKQCLEVSPNKLKPLEVVADLTIEDDCKRLIRSTVERFGKIDILVNSAGEEKASKITDEDYIEKFRDGMETNLNTVVYMTHFAVEELAKTKGNIINISSCLGFVTYKGFSVLCMAKSAVNMFTKCMAVELGPQRIRVNSVNPGLTKTDGYKVLGISKQEYEDYCKEYAKKYPVGRVGTPEDVANATLYLSTENASFITGTNFVVDGGHIAANVG